MHALQRLLMLRIRNVLVHSERIYMLTHNGKETVRHARIVREAALDVIKARHRESDSSSSPSEKQRDLVDLLMHARDPETGEGLSDDEIVDQITTFFFAGYGT